MANNDSSPKLINIKYYALLREQRGENGEVVTTTASTPFELYGELKLKYKFSLAVDMLKVAINDDFQDWGYELQDKDSVVFIPPVAGG
jgi:molybdopterin converting factor small subunit